MDIKYFTDLDAWKVNHKLVLEIYKITRSFPKEEKYGVIDQLRRAASSITANIAEGWGRFHYGDRVKFYHQARGSSCEVQNYLILSKDLAYIKEEEFKKLKTLAFEGYKVINGLIRSVESFKT